MPRSKRRKGAKRRVQEARRHMMHTRETMPRNRYDPGKNPRPRNFSKTSQSPQSTAAQRNTQRGG